MGADAVHFPEEASTSNSTALFLLVNSVFDLWILFEFQMKLIIVFKRDLEDVKWSGSTLPLAIPRLLVSDSLWSHGCVLNQNCLPVLPRRGFRKDSLIFLDATELQFSRQGRDQPRRSVRGTYGPIWT